MVVVILSGGSGTRTYDFQIADNSNFSPIALSKLSVIENSSGKTSVIDRLARSPDAFMHVVDRHLFPGWLPLGRRGTSPGKTSKLPESSW